MEYTLTHLNVGTATLLVLFDGVPYEADSNHPWWDEIVDLVLEDDPRVLDLFPIRPVQQPSNLIENEDFDHSASFLDAAFGISEEEALRAYERIVGFAPDYCGGQDADEENLDKPGLDDLPGLRAYFDQV